MRGRNRTAIADICCGPRRPHAIHFIHPRAWHAVDTHLYCFDIAIGVLLNPAGRDLKSFPHLLPTGRHKVIEGKLWVHTIMHNSRGVSSGFWEVPILRRWLPTFLKTFCLLHCSSNIKLAKSCFTNLYVVITPSIHQGLFGVGCPN